MESCCHTEAFVPLEQCPNLIGLIFGDQTIHALVFLFRKHAGCICSSAIAFGLHLLDDRCAITDQDIRSSVRDRRNGWPMHGGWSLLLPLHG